MDRFIDLFEENVRTFPDRVSIATDVNDETMTFGQLDEISGRIYNYLDANGIGKEDFVMLLLPRGAKIVAAMMGVLKSGAAFTIVEDTYPADRVEYIRKDFNTRLVIDNDLYETINSKWEYKPGHKETDKHDAAFAVYTSGTTGNPKGVLHEYGKIEICVDMKRDINAAPTKNALGSPLNFVASIMTVLIRLTLCSTLYILSYETAKNLDKYFAFLEKQQMDSAFITPSMFRIMKNRPACINTIFLGGEPANGIYDPDVKAVNCYGTSESGFIIAKFIIDRKYDVTPVGRNDRGIELLILDEDGNRLPDGQLGEVCFENKYTRGYINLPEQTAKAFINGIYHTGDLGYKDVNGNVVISGRSDDMIKINGNRIEPSEIENVVKDELGLNNVVAKGFNGKGRSYIALYYLKSEEDKLPVNFSVSELNERISGRLPGYMLPTYYVPMDRMPINQNGKISRKLLKEPVIETEMDFVEPENELEKEICNAMAQTLSLDKISVEADFFAYGGDSLSAISFVTDYKEYGISSADLYKLRTPRKLAAFVEKNRMNPDIKELDEAARNKMLPLLHGQKMLLISSDGEYKCDAPITHFWKLKDGVDVDRLAKAIDKTIWNHPALLTGMAVDEGGVLKQYYDETRFKPVEVCHLEEDNAEEIAKTLIGSFSCTSDTLYRIRIFVTPKGNYFFVCLSHIIADGASFNIFAGDFIRMYMDEKYEALPDYYFAILEDMTRSTGSAEYNEAREYYEDTFRRKGNIDDLGGKYFRCDHEYSNPDADIVGVQLDLQKSKAYGNVFFATAAALAAARYNEEDRALIYWIHNERGNVVESSSMGQLVKTLPLFLHIKENDTPKSLLEQAREQVEKGIAFRQYNYFEENDIDVNGVMRFIYQKDMLVDRSRQDNPIVEETYNLYSDTLKNVGLSSSIIIDNSEDDAYRYVFKYTKYNTSRENAERFAREMQDAIAYLSEVK